ncbi:ABC transporter substrate-binding protein [Nocardioides sp. R-C-SC26]|uniref:ABC transporter substrate-binding protein n=1 Tax=Nocardioides sp. R-C-SC26 TaxID=2870414 RepID=UPI001E40CE34|nr:ABC transporter substrate-binding protein [Nocardioides sp. R-C-SC26]
MRLKKTASALIAGALLLAASACGGDDGGDETADGKAKVSVNTLPLVALAPMFVAEDKGFFAEEDIENSYTDADIYAQLALQSQGKLDVNIPGLGGAFYNAINENLKFKAVADRNQYKCTSDSIFLVRTEAADGGLDSIADLKGKKVAILARGSSTEYWLSRALAEENLTIDDLGGLTTLGYPDIANALKTGAVDAGFLTQPIAYGLMADGTAQRMLATYEIVPDNQQGVISMSEDFLDNRPEVAERWIAGWLKGVRYYLDPANREEVVQIIADNTQVPAETVDAIYGTDQWPYMNPNGEVDTTRATEDDGAWLVENGIVENLPEVGDWYDDTPLQAALEELGTVDADRDCSQVERLEVP